MVNSFPCHWIDNKFLNGSCQLFFWWYYGIRLLPKMRVLVTGLPGDTLYFSDFQEREDFLARVASEFDCEVISTVKSSREGLVEVYKSLVDVSRDNQFDRILFEHSGEKRPDIVMALVSALAKGTPALFLRPDFFNDGIFQERKLLADGRSVPVTIKDFVKELQGVGARVGFEYYCASKVESHEYNDPANREVKRMVGRFLIVGGIEREVVLSGREREV